MFSLFKKKITKKIVTGFVVLILICLPASTFFAPSKANAQLFGGGTDIVKDIENTLTNTLQTALVGGMSEKELVLDGIFYNIAQQALQQMTEDIITFFNTGRDVDGDGESDGEPMFITDYKKYVADAREKAVVETYDNDLETLCEPIKVSIAVAMSVQFQLSKPESVPEVLRCTIDKPGVDVEAFYGGSFSAGGWSTWFETILNPQNTSLGGLGAANNAAASAADLAAWEAMQKQKDGVVPLEACTTTNTPTGNRQDCEIITPAVLVLGQVSAALNVPMESLLNADEFDEIIGSLFTNLANEALTGINGLLGLTDPNYGAGGNQTYFDAVKDDTSDDLNTGSYGSNPIENALATEIRVGGALVGIINDVSDLTRCTPETVLPVELEAVLDDYTPLALTQAEVVSELSILSQRYASSTTAAERQTTLSAYEQMVTDGELSGLAKALEYELYRSGELADAIEAFKLETGYVEISCTVPPTS